MLHRLPYMEDELLLLEEASSLNEPLRFRGDSANQVIGHLVRQLQVERVNHRSATAELQVWKDDSARGLKLLIETRRELEEARLVAWRVGMLDAAKIADDLRDPETAQKIRGEIERRKSL